MADIILLWNFHPNESPVTFAMARKLKQALEAKGHTVRIEKIPFSQTLHGTGKKGRQLSGEPTNQYVKRISENYTNSLIIEMHCTPIQNYRLRLGKDMFKPKKWTAIENPEPGFNRIMAAIEILETKELGQRTYLLEFPAIYKQANTNLRKLGIIGKYPIPTHFFPYFSQQADLKATEKAGILSTTVIRRITGVLEKVIGRYKELHKKPTHMQRRMRKIKRKQARRIK